MIRAEGLRVHFGRTVALASVDLALEPGVHGLFGPNGSGKSTLLRVLAGLVPPTAGEVTWEGRRVDASDESFRQRVGYAGHSSGLYGRLTVHENLVLFSRLYGARSQRADEMASLVGLGEELGRPVRELSAGLKRRAAVARALLHEPDLLLLDEPYANLDDEASELVSHALRTWRGPGRTAVVATHGAKRLKGWVNGGVVLRRGTVAVAGSYERARTGLGARSEAAG